MNQEVIELVTEMRNALLGLKAPLLELAEATERLAKAIEAAAEEIRDAE